VALKKQKQIEEAKLAKERQRQEKMELSREERSKRLQEAATTQANQQKKRRVTCVSEITSDDVPVLQAIGALTTFHIPCFDTVDDAKRNFALGHACIIRPSSNDKRNIWKFAGVGKEASLAIKAFIKEFQAEHSQLTLDQPQRTRVAKAMPHDLWQLSKHLCFQSDCVQAVSAFKETHTQMIHVRLLFGIPLTLPIQFLLRCVESWKRLSWV
jgi:hypothetical protein